MKKFFVFIICIIAPMVCAAQYYNPYAGHDFNNCSGKVTCGACYGTGNCYGYVCMSCGGTGMMNCAACAGYKQGQQMGKQFMEQREQQLRQNPLMMSGVAVTEMANGQYAKAYDHFEYLAENYDDASSWLYMGYMNELGMGTSKSYDYAKICYSNGAKLGQRNCKIELQRIKQGKYLGNECKARLRGHFQNIVTMSNQAVGAMDWGLSSGSSSGSSSSSSQRQSDYGYVNCPHCHGTGACSVCNNRGWQDSPYTGNSMRCSSCQGAKYCKFCSGKGARYKRVR